MNRSIFLQKWLFFSILMIYTLNSTLAQSISSTSVSQTGVVSYVSKESVYVRFNSTSEIRLGDTLFQFGSRKPVLIVSKKSSISTINTRIGSTNLLIGDSILFFAKIQTLKTILKKEENLILRDGKNQIIRSADSVVRKSIPQETTTKSWLWHGNNSITSRYNQTLGSEANRGMNQQYGRFHVRGAKNDSLNSLAVHLSGNYQQFSSSFRSSEAPKAGRLYLNQAEIQWRPNSALEFRLGRGFQNGLSSMGALDAARVSYKKYQLQLEAVGGFAPNFRTHQFSTENLAYGLSLKTEQYKKTIKWDASLGWIDQYSQGQIDRRLMLLQGSIFNKKSYAYFLIENDFTQGINESRVQSTYVSMQHRWNSKWNSFFSYDTRTPWIYWRSYDQLTIDDLMEREAQRGFRVRLNYKSSKNINWGFQSTVRTTNFKKDMMLLGVNVTRSNLFWRGSSLSYRLNLADYNSLWQNAQQIIRWSMYKQNQQFSMYYRSNLYSRRIELGSIFNQNSAGLQYSFPLKKGYELDAFFEYNFQQQQQHLFCYLTLNKRF